MTLRPSKKLAVLTLLGLPALVLAQESSNEEERLQRLMSDTSAWYVPQHRVSIGFRILSSGGKVTFGNLGNVPFEIEVPALSEGAVARSYNNGAVNTDAPRAPEKDADGNQTSTPGGRYATFADVTVNVVDADGNPVLDANGAQVTTTVNVQSGDYRAYMPGYSRVWGYASDSQVSADGTRVAMSTYSATSDGAGFSKDADKSGGVEFQYVRTLSKPTARWQFGVLAGATLNGINSKNAGTIAATLHTRTDTYAIAPGETVPGPAPYNSALAFDDYTAITGDVFPDALEKTVPIGSLPIGPTVETTTPGGVNIDGNWQVKGAYFMFRVGPTIRTQLTNRIGVNASVGYAGAYAGTVYSVAERFQVPDVPEVYVGDISATEENRATKFLSGYYADFNVEWAANERMGLFTGVTAQKFDGYDQEVGGRTARIDLGSSVGLRGGVSIRF